MTMKNYNACHVGANVYKWGLFENNTKDECSVFIQFYD